MKRLAFIAIAVSALVLASCATTETKGSGVKGKAAKVQVQKSVLIDYQGSVLGKEIPAWVESLIEGQYSQESLKKVMPNVEGKKVFVAIGRGDNLDFVKQWTDLVDIEVEVGDTMQRVVGKSVEAHMKGAQKAEGTDASTSEVEKSIEMAKKAVSAVELNGLEKIASYWVLVQRTNKDGQTNEFYEYYSVWGMDEKIYQAQLNEALKGISDNTSAGGALKDALVKDLMGVCLPSSNDKSLVDDAEATASFGDN